MNFSRRIENSWILMHCLVRFPFYGKADRVPKNISRIIVMPDGKLGDVICGTPVLAALRKNFPDARIIVGGNSTLHRALLSNSNLVDEYLEFDRDISIVKQIKKCNADIALVTGPTFEATALFYLAGVSLIVAPRVMSGYSPLETWPYKILQRFIRTFPYRMGTYAPRERLRVLEPLSIRSDNTTKHLGFSETADKKIKQFFIDKHIDGASDFVVGISPSAGHKIKEWPGERFAEVADYLNEKYQAKVIIIGGARDTEKVKKTTSHMKSGTRAVVVTDFNLDELKALISKLNLFISVDTGPIYIAEAFDVPTIDITGPIDENEQPPRGPLHRNIVPPHRKHPELFVLDARSYNTGEALRQVHSISTAQVTGEIDALLKSGCIPAQKKIQ